MKETRIPESSCPLCLTMLDVAADLRGQDTPTPGDVTICTNCGEVLYFKEDMTLRSTTQEEMDEIKENHPNTHAEILEVRRLIKDRVVRN